MALINCPECKKEVSDRAHSCPFCGFPLDEYFEEKAEETQRAIEAEEKSIRLQKLEQRKCEYAEVKELKVCGKKIGFNVNEKICAIIGADFEVCQENLHKSISELLFLDEGPAHMGAHQFNSYAHKLISNLENALVETSISLCNRFLHEDERERIHFEEDLKSAADTRALVQALKVVYEQAHDEYQLNVANAHSQYHDDYYAAGTPAVPIKEVWSSTLIGLAGASISAKLVNGVAEALTSGTVKQKQEEAWDKFSAELWKEAMICNIKIYSVLDNYVDAVVAAYKQYLIEYLVNTGVLFEKYVYPTENVEYDAFVEIMQNQESLHKEKVAAFKKIVEINPADYMIYVYAMEYMSLKVEDVRELIALYDFFEIREDIKEQLIDDKHPAAVLLEESSKIDGKLVHACSFMARALGDRGFATVEEKEAYIAGANSYENLLNEFEAIENWFDISHFTDSYNKLAVLGKPKFDTWQERYEKAIAIGEPIVKEINNQFVKSVLPALLQLVPGEAIFKYSKEDVWERRNSLLEHYKALQEEFAEEELPIVLIATSSGALLISTRAFYNLNNSNGTLIVKFDIDDIRRINADQFGIKLYLEEKKYKIFDGYFPQKQLPSLIKFTKAIISYVENNPVVKRERTEQLCKRTSRDYLNEEYLQGQWERAAKMLYLLDEILEKNNIHDRSNIVMKWTYEVTEQDSLVLYKAINENRMGIEFILLFDGYKIITDSAIYTSPFFLTVDNVSMTRYRFADALEIIPTTVRKTSSYGLFLTKDEGTSLILQDRDASKLYYDGIRVVSLVLKEEGINPPILIDKQFVYCGYCNTFTFGNTDEITSCSECGKQIDGWVNYSFYEGYQKILSAMTDEDLQEYKRGIELEVNLILKCAFPKTKEKVHNKKTEAVGNQQGEKIPERNFTSEEIQAAELFDEYYKNEGGYEKVERGGDLHNSHANKMAFLYKYYKNIDINLLPEASETATRWKEFWINHNANDNNFSHFTWYDSIEWIPLDVDIYEFIRCISMQKRLYSNAAVISEIWFWGESEDSVMSPNKEIRETIEIDDTILMYHDGSVDKQGKSGLVLTQKYIIGLDGFKCLEIEDIIDIRLYLDGYIKIETATQEILYRNEQWDRTDKMFIHLVKFLHVFCVRYGKNSYLWNKKMNTPKPNIAPYKKTQNVEKNEFLKRFKTLVKADAERRKNLKGVLVNHYDYNIYNQMPPSTWFITREEQGEYVLYVAQDFIITERNVYIYQDKFGIDDIAEILVGNKLNSQNSKYKSGIEVITRSGDIHSFDFSNGYDDAVIYILNLCLASVNGKNSDSMLFKSKGYFCVKCGALDIERKVGLLGPKFRCIKCGNKDDRYLCAYGDYFSMKTYDERILEITQSVKG